MGDVGKLKGRVLGTQADYRNVITSDMVDGVTLALAELGKSRAPRKLMIVVGDNTDTNIDTASTELARLKKAAQQQQVAIAQLVLVTPLSQPSTRVFSATARTLSSPDNLAVALAGILASLDDRYYVTFPSHDPKLKKSFAWDGKPFDVVVAIGRDDQAEAHVSVGTRWP